MVKVIIFLGVLFTINLSGQTKLIAHKSHGGNTTNFSLKEDGNLGLAFPIIVFYDENDENDENNKNKETIKNLTNSNFEVMIIKTKEGLIFNNKSDFEKYKKLRATNGESGLMLVILDENYGNDLQLVERLTDEKMKNDWVRYYIKSKDGFIFETKSEFDAYKKLRTKRDKMGIQICELDEDKDALKIRKLTDSKMRKGNIVYFIKTRDGVVFDLRSTFENYKKLRELKSKNENIDFIMISKNDSILNIANDSVLVNKKDKNFIIPSRYNKSTPTDKTPLLIVIISLTMIILSLILWKIEIKKINSKKI